MTPDQNARVTDIYHRVIRPVHEGLAREFGIPDSPAADAMSLAPGWQESKFATRDQADAANAIGPATGWFQFEKNGGVAEILEARQTQDISRQLCARAGVNPDRDPVWRLFTTAAGDELACAFARLLVWKDAASLPLPVPASASEAYAYYDRNWRPGKKRPNDWPASWAVALEVVGAGAASAPPSSPSPPAGLPQAPGGALDARVAALEATMARLAAALRV